MGGSGSRSAAYEVFPVNPMPVARYRERDSVSGANSDAADAPVLAEIVRPDSASPAGRGR